MSTDKSRENRLRRWAKRLGLFLQHSRKKRVHVADHGQYALIDPDNNTPLYGHCYDISLDTIEQALAVYEKKLIAERL